MRTVWVWLLHLECAPGYDTCQMTSGTAAPTLYMYITFVSNRSSSNTIKRTGGRAGGGYLRGGVGVQSTFDRSARRVLAQKAASCTTARSSSFPHPLHTRLLNLTLYPRVLQEHLHGRPLLRISNEALLHKV
jgi:hypothetical protein